MGNSVAAETKVSTSIVHFCCTFRTEMSEWSGDGGPYLSEYEGEILVGLENDVDEFRLAGRARLFIVNPDAAEDDEEAPSLFELLDLRGETAAYHPWPVKFPHLTAAGRGDGRHNLSGHLRPLHRNAHDVWGDAELPVSMNGELSRSRPRKHDHGSIRALAYPVRISTPAWFVVVIVRSTKRASPSWRKAVTTAVAVRESPGQTCWRKRAPYRVILPSPTQSVTTRAVAPIVHIPCANTVGYPAARVA
jgi:hypothetical protein